ncbi:hypothetical protein SHJG_5726 [Streptomyces hygroscopicus subsp. jinggangensis 5008]|nr:hypothetical protein SHJG_5726 [Streptomyces hygroscopicus subsp. jinggangensis 5008]AGF65150.1 hypothetical protein SHJGH_5487 [Streptomyces hygroscopicus subsp. jinggangensis TL01]
MRGAHCVVGFVRCHVCLTSVVGGGCPHAGPLLRWSTLSRHSHPKR